ncbi:MAG: hypothetical protein HUJ68_11300 [Clostridia bacterium]|nr:hypothetical protein [Clostridia bacterium]
MLLFSSHDSYTASKASDKSFLRISSNSCFLVGSTIVLLTILIFSIIIEPLMTTLTLSSEQA